MYNDVMSIVTEAEASRHTVESAVFLGRHRT